MFRIARFTFNPFQENTWVVHNDRRAILVDPGCADTEEERELEHFLAQNALEPVRLVLSHAHADHVMGCAWAERRYGLRPELHRDALPYLEGAPRSAQLFGVHCEPSPPPKGFLAEGDVVELDGDTMQVLFVPGHAQGHIALYCEAQGFVLAGDVLFQRSIGRTDLPGGDLDTLLASIRDQLLTLPDATVVHSGHGPDTTIGEERAHNPFLRGL